MNKTDTDILARIKKSLMACFRQLEDKPIIYIDKGSRHRANSLAKEIVSRSGVPIEDFIEWIKAGSSHLQNIVYRNIEVHICMLPKKEVIALLRVARKDHGIEEVNLTEKESEIVHYISEGFSNKEIAKKIGRSPGTVNSHLDNIYRKLGCSSRLEASLIALKNGLFLSPQRRKACKVTK